MSTFGSRVQCLRSRVPNGIPVTCRRSPAYWNTLTVREKVDAHQVSLQIGSGLGFDSDDAGDNSDTSHPFLLLQIVLYLTLHPEPADAESRTCHVHLR